MKAPSQPFAGVPTGTTKFLTGLDQHNTKEWFEEHRADYERFWVDVGLQLVVALGDGLRTLEPKVAAEPKINGSIFRIHRDTRFSKDKTPYKNHLDLWFWDDVAKKEAKTGFWLRIQGKTWGIGVGNYGFSKESLQTYREAVAHPKRGAALIKAVEEVEAAGFPVSGEKYKRLPAGFDVAGDAMRERLIRHGHLTAGNAAMPHPKDLRTAAFVKGCLEQWTRLHPIHKWLKATLQEQ